MSASDTNIDRQIARHRPSLGAIALSLGAVALIVLGVVIWNGVPGEDQAAPAVTVE